MSNTTLIGRLATDADPPRVTDGSQVATFILAVDRNADEADFFRIRCWASQAEAVAENLVKGRRATVEGSLRQDAYKKDGGERRSVSVVARRVEYL